MGLINNIRRERNFATIKNGKVVLSAYEKDAEGNNIGIKETSYDAIEGVLTSVGRRDLESKGQVYHMVDIVLTDRDEDFVLSFNESNSVLESLIMALATMPSFKNVTIKISAWPTVGKDGKEFTNVSVRANGNLLSWAVAPKDRPATRQVVINGQPVTDKTDRIKFVLDYVSRINAVLAADTATPQNESPVQPEDIDDMPADL